MFEVLSGRFNRKDAEVAENDLLGAMRLIKIRVLCGLGALCGKKAA
jgi:hypothetical protein